MSIEPHEFIEAFLEPKIPDTCNQQVPCTKNTNGKPCYRKVAFGKVYDELDPQTQKKIGVPAKPCYQCPDQYLNVVNKCLFGPQSERIGCPKNMGNPYNG